MPSVWLRASALKHTGTPHRGTVAPWHLGTVAPWHPSTAGSLFQPFDDLLARVIDARERVRKQAGDSPVLLKIAPDLSLAELDDVVHIARSRKVDGMIVANTTVRRMASLRDPNAIEPGGLSGKPLFTLATRMLAETYVRVEGQFPLVGVGGIDSGATALASRRVILSAAVRSSVTRPSQSGSRGRTCRVSGASLM